MSSYDLVICIFYITLKCIDHFKFCWIYNTMKSKEMLQNDNIDVKPILFQTCIECTYIWKNEDQYYMLHNLPCMYNIHRDLYFHRNGKRKRKTMVYWKNTAVYFWIFYNQRILFSKEGSIYVWKGFTMWRVHI